MLNSREAFKAGFLKRCADAGLNQEETLSAIKQASAAMEKASYLPLVNWIRKNPAKSVAGYLGRKVALPLLLFGPAAAGVGGAALYAKATDTDDTDVESARKEELADMYRAQANRIKGNRRSYASP